MFVICSWCVVGLLSVVCSRSAIWPFEVSCVDDRESAFLVGRLSGCLKPSPVVGQLSGHLKPSSVVGSLSDRSKALVLMIVNLLEV